MTRPRARPKPGRYWVVLEAGRMIGVGHTVRQASEWAAAGHNVVECVPMPRVRSQCVNATDSIVCVNGIEVFSGDHGAVHDLARDLRRALRGK